MGSALGNTCRAVDRLWVSEGRSPATAGRATAAGLRPVSSLDELSDGADVIVSICPPAAAVEVAQQVLATGFDGIYVDANAISPERSRSIGELFDRYVDGSVVGPPPTSPGTTRLYLSGPTELTDSVAELWAGSNTEARSVGTAPGAASALKMAYAGWTKGSAALLLAVAALAEAEGVGGALRGEWGLSQPDLAQRLDRSAVGAAPKAWRFVGEMDEIAQSMSTVGLPDGFHHGAAELYGLLANFKDHEPTLDDVVERLAAEPSERQDQ